MAFARIPMTNFHIWMNKNGNYFINLVLKKRCYEHILVFNNKILKIYFAEEKISLGGIENVKRVSSRC